jgi:hypothetical protein
MQNPGETKNSLLSDASKRLEQALKHVDISEDAIARLQHPYNYASTNNLNCLLTDHLEV